MTAADQPKRMKLTMLKSHWALWGAVVGGVAALLVAALSWFLSATTSASSALTVFTQTPDGVGMKVAVSVGVGT
jgi:hypothetical protein